jgi:hypothetical protein
MLNRTEWCYVKDLPRNRSHFCGYIEAVVGKHVVLSYELHINVPTSCFGATEYFVTGTRMIE